MQLLLKFGILFSLIFPGLPANAEIYSWKDENGKVHFGDRPPLNQATEQVTVRVNTYTARSEITKTKFISNSKGKVVLYTTQRCGYCIKAKYFLRQEKIRYTEYDVETSNKGKRDFKKMQGKGVPIVLVGEQRMNGYTEKHMIYMLVKAGYEL